MGAEPPLLISAAATKPARISLAEETKDQWRHYAAVLSKRGTWHFGAVWAPGHLGAMLCDWHVDEIN